MLQMAIDPTERRATPRQTLERRRGPKAHVPPTIEDLRRPDGRPLRLRDLVALTGWSKAKLLADIRAGYLRPEQALCGRHFTWLVPYREAQRYLCSLGVLKV